MAARVNVKFVIVLGVVLVLATVAVALVSVAALKKSGDTLVAAGDERMAAGDYEEAVTAYSKAVAKDQRNAGWIRKWIAAMEKTTPETRNAYGDAYRGQFMPALRALTESDRADAAAHRRYLDEVFKGTRYGRAALADWEQLARVSDELIKNYNGDEAGAKSLRRYRGIAKSGVLSQNSDMAAEQIEAARADLTAALEADPKDTEAAINLSAIDAALAERSRQAGEAGAYEKGMETAIARLRDFAERNPPAATARLALVRLELGAAARAATGTKVTVGEVMRDKQPLIQGAVDAFLAEPAAATDVATALGLAPLAIQALPEGNAAATRILEHAAAGHPGDPTLLLGWSRLDIGTGRTAEATARLQSVVDLPERPLSFEGLLLDDQRAEAILLQADADLAAWERSKDPAERATLAASVKTRRDAVAAKRGEDEPRVLLLDAKLKWIEGDAGGARSLLGRFNERTGERDASAMLLLGQINRQQGNTGAAQKAFERALQLEPRETRALMNLADLAAQARDYRQAYLHANQAATLMPENAALREAADRYAQLAGDASERPSDRVLDGLSRVQKMLDTPGSDARETVRSLRELVAAHPADPRPARILAEILFDRLNDKAGAVAVLTEAAARMPDNREIAEQRAFYASEDPAEFLIAKIEASGATPLQKRLARHEIRVRYRQAEEARAELAAAAEIAPQNAGVISAQMTDAMSRGDAAEVDRVVALAEKHNTDQVRGLTFRARRDILAAQRLGREGKREEVVDKLEATEQALQQASELDKQNPAVHQLLGLVRQELGTNALAVASFARAYEIRPNDATTVAGYLKTLAASGDTARALAVARAARDSGLAGGELTELRLALEAEAPGGDRAGALAERRAIAAGRPDDLNNRAQLAVLLMQDKAFDEALAQIEALKGKSPDESIVRLESMYFALQGKPEEAAAVLQRSLDAAPAEGRTGADHVRAARLMMEMGQPDRAAAFLEAGRPLQDPKAMEIDRELGDLLFNTRRLAPAIEAYRRVLEAGSPDDNDMIAKRIAEAMLLSGEHAKLDEMLAAMGDRAQRDPTLLLLAASSAEAQGDSARARTLYDRSIAADPKAAIGFIRRADFTRADPAAAKDAALLKDAELDYEKAASLQPENPLPRVRLAEIFAATGRPDGAVEQLRKAVASSPGADELRERLIGLLASLGREAEMTEALQDALRASDNSLPWLVRGARLMSERGRPDRAASLLGQAWDKAKSPEMANVYVSALLGKEPPDVQAAQRVLQDDAVKADAGVHMRLTRAKVLAALNRPTEAEKELDGAAVALNADDPTSVDLFTNGLAGVHKKPTDQAAYMGRLAAKRPLTGLMEVRHGTIMLDAPETKAQGEAKLRGIVDSSQNPELRLFLIRLLSSRAYAEKRIEDAVALFRKGLEVDPDNVEFNNNLAYALARELSKPEEALPFAQKAVELDPNAPMILDTLGTVQIELKQNDKAAATLTKAFERSRGDQERTPIAIHLATALLNLGQKDEALRLAGVAQAAIQPGSPLEAAYGVDLKELFRRLDAQ